MIFNPPANQCFHCGETNPADAPWSVEFDGQARTVCCVGCEAIMQAIVEAKLDDYYRFRTEPAVLGVVPPSIGAALDALSVYDEAEISERYLRQVDDDGATVTKTDSSSGSAAALQSAKVCLSEVNLAVEGLRCGACVWLLEKSVRREPGVSSANFNFSTARARVQFDPEKVPLSQVLRVIASVGYNAVPFDAREREAALKRETRSLLQRLFVSGIAMTQVMMYALPAYLSDAGEIDPAHEQLLRWVSLVLTTPVILYAAQPFLAGAWRDLKALSPGMDVPVTIGVLAAFSASVHATLTGQGEIYFDSVSMFVFLLLGARYLEWSVRRRAMRAIDDIGAVAPETAVRLVPGDDTSDPDTAAMQPEVVPAVRLEVGDLIQVNSGERIPVDARVEFGSSAIDNAVLTGESLPVAVAPGDHIAGGALLAGAPLRLVVERPQSDSALSMIERLVDRGASEKPRLVGMADRVAAWFVSVLLVITALVWLVWSQHDASRAAAVAIAVLVVSCPCALSLATPSALAAATGQLLRSRLLVTRGHVLETLARVTDVVFDKTGTLTHGRPEVLAIQCAEFVNPDSALALVAALESGSSHPYAMALTDAWRREGQRQSRPEDRSLHAIHHESGHGVSAVMQDGAEIRLGSRQWCGVADADIDALADAAEPNNQANSPSDRSAVVTISEDAASEVILARQPVGASPSSATSVRAPQLMARFLLQDPLRPETKSTVQALQEMGLAVHLLSGDRAAAVTPIAQQLGISQQQAGALPSDKQTYVAALQAKGATVLMVGDGINDAPVLAASDVSLAVGNASALAQTAADAISLAPGLENLVPMLVKARQTMRVVRQNLLWALVYNLIAIPAAAMGLVPPWAAAVGMASSSLLVVGNALRLWSLPASTGKLAPGKQTLWNRCTS